jgi:hypothetical protein
MTYIYFLNKCDLKLMKKDWLRYKKLKVKQILKWLMNFMIKHFIFYIKQMLL